MHIVCFEFFKRHAPFFPTCLMFADSVCIESMSVTVGRRILDKSSQNIQALQNHLQRQVFPTFLSTHCFHHLTRAKAITRLTAALPLVLWSQNKPLSVFIKF